MCHLHSYFVLCSVLGTPTVGDIILFTNLYREESEAGRKLIAFSHLHGQQVVESKFNCKFNLHQFQSSYFFFQYVLVSESKANTYLIYFTTEKYFTFILPFDILSLSWPWSELILSCYYNGF